MKRRIITIVIALVVIVAAVCALTLTGGEVTYIKDVDSQKLDEAYKLLNTSYLDKGEEAEVYYTDYIKQHTEAGQGNYDAVLNNGVNAKKYYQKNKTNDSVPAKVKDYNGQMKELDYRDVAEYKVNVAKDGLYYLNLDYISVGNSLSDYTISASVNGKQQYTEMKTIALPIIWEDAGKTGFISSDDKKKFPVDSYGDEMAPSQNRVQEWINTYIYNNTYVSSTPLAFDLKKGENIIRIENVSSGGLALGNMKVEAATDNNISYKDYAAKHSDAELVKDSESALEIDAVYYSKKNSTDAIYGTEAKDSLTRFNIDYEKLNTSKLAKLISYVPQEHKPPFPFTVREMILMGRSPYMGGIFGLKKEDYIEAEKAIEMVNIADISDKPVTALSGGQRQLTLIARSIAQNAPVMILDEPTSALDFNNQITIWKILKKLAETGKLIIACSHDPNHILWFAENTLVIKNGEILANGKTDDVITNSLLKEIYGIEYNILHNDNCKIIQPVL